MGKGNGIHESHKKKRQPLGYPLLGPSSTALPSGQFASMARLAIFALSLPGGLGTGDDDVLCARSSSFALDCHEDNGKRKA